MMDRIRLQITFVSVILLLVILSACSQYDNISSTVEPGGADHTGNRGDTGDTGEGPLMPTETYIVVFKRDHVQLMALEKDITAMTRLSFVSRKLLAQSIMSEMSMTYDLPKAKRIFSVALQGAVIDLNTAQAEKLSRDSRVAYVEKDQIIHLNALQENVTWGLDRLDQASLPLDNKYNYTNANQQVNAYIIDTGLLTTHQDFQGRAFHGYDFIDKDSDATDCNGHGTHVAGTIGGATYGVAKNVKLYGVRVLDCFGSGTYSTVIAGVEWVTAHHLKPAIVNMSLGGPVSQALDDAVLASIQAGVTYVVAAGNENQSACDSSPSRIDLAISVGSTTKTDERSSFSNYGPCVDVFAPGSDIQSAWYTSSTATNTISGTSMATPHVAGVAALYLSKHPNATPSEVKNTILEKSVSGRISNVGAGSPNLLVNTQFLNGDNSGGGDGNGDGNDEIIPQIENGESKINLAGSKNDKIYFKVKLPANSRNLKITIAGGRGDADLYTKMNFKPTLINYNCRPYRSGNAETCWVASPKAGILYIMLRGYSAFSHVKLSVSFRVQ